MRPDCDDPLELCLRGAPCLRTPGGAALSLVSTKAQALLALLACAPGQRRARAWVQERLWSISPPKEAAASLRQAVAALRRALGPAYHDVLISERRMVGLNMGRLQMRLPEGRAPLLEGFVVDDPAFMRWLAEHRQSLGTAAPTHASGFAEAQDPFVADMRKGRGARPSPARVLVIEAQGPPSSAPRAREDEFIDILQRNLSEMMAWSVCLTPPPEPGPGMRILTVQALALDQGARPALRLVLHRAADLSVEWTDILELPSGGDRGHERLRLYGLSQRAISALIAAAARPEVDVPGDRDAGYLAARALLHMFSMEHGALETADRLLVQAIALDPRGSFHGWRAQLATIRYIERTGADPDMLREISRDSAVRALALDRNNSSVLSSVANARLVFDGDIAASGELARMSVETNPANPLAWWASSNARLYAGQAEEAHSAALMSQRLAARSHFRFWSDFQVCLTAAVTGRTDEAVKHGELSGALAPFFRPPQRYLTALYARDENRDGAQMAARRLKALEADFSYERLAHDPAYPVSMARSAGLIDPAHLRDLEQE